MRSPISYISDLTLSKKETGKLSIRIGTGGVKPRSSDPHVIITEKFREIFSRHEKGGKLNQVLLEFCSCGVKLFLKPDNLDEKKHRKINEDNDKNMLNCRREARLGHMNIKQSISHVQNGSLDTKSSPMHLKLVHTNETLQI